MSNQTEIFVSYAWKGASEALVDQLCEAFAARGYTITRDKSAMTYKDSIQQFMQRIGQGRYIIAVVSDKYMKSEYCMYEAYRMFQSPAFSERVFPIVLPDADVFSFRGQAAYLKYWDQAYKELAAEYREIASSSPTMVAPLTERLRDIETTTRFINDFMAAVGDMNVLTSEIHLESNFQALIAAIEAGMQKSETKEQANMPADNSAKGSRNIHVGGDYIEGNIGGDHFGGDKIEGHKITAGDGSVIQTHNAAVTQQMQVIQQIYAAIEQRPNTDPLDKEDLKANVDEIKAEDEKGDQADETFIARRLRNLQRMAPDILEVVLAAIANPAAGFGMVAKKVAEKMQAGA